MQRWYLVTTPAKPIKNKNNKRKGRYKNGNYQRKNPTIKDIIDGQSPDGKTVLDLVNLLSQENPFMEDAVVRECNQNDQHTEVVMTSMPTIKSANTTKVLKAPRVHAQNLLMQLLSTLRAVL